MEKKKLLRAELHNWGLIGQGYWKIVTWNIFRDGSYTILREFIPERDAKTTKSRENHKTEELGTLDKDRLDKLKEQIDREPWRNPNIKCRAFDGVAWVIEAFSDNGDIVKTSGELDYIYGHEVLESIVKYLPRDGMPINAPAYINVKEDDETVADYVML